MCCFTLSIHTLRLSVGGRTHGRTDGRTHGRMENIYSIFRDKLLLPGEHGLHKMAVEAIAVIRQFDYENGHPPFEVC
jgi:hypothetical protein